MSKDLQLASWRPREADDVAVIGVWRPENHESQKCKSSLRSDRIKTQEKMMFQLESEVRKIPISQLKAFGLEEFPIT